MCPYESTDTKSDFIRIHFPEDKGLKEINFKDLFKGNSTEHIKAKCSRCKKETYFEEKQTMYIYPETKYIIVNVLSSAHNGRNAFRNEIDINNFDPDRVEIPNLPNCTFWLKSAICYISGDGNNYSKAGHYIICCRSLCNTGWMNISDDVGSFHSNFMKNLKNVVIMLLEKI